MKFRTYGKRPFKVVLIHGGPGAPGEVTPVARELSPVTGILEPLQTAASLNGQLEELKAAIRGNAAIPLALVGWSWGAMLGFIFAAKHPQLVKKLILVSSPPFEEKYVPDIMRTRMGRLAEKEQTEIAFLMRALDDPDTEGKDYILAQLGSLIDKADSYDPIPHDDEMLECRYDIHQRVWQEAAAFRKDSRLLALADKIRCPVVAIHGDYDPHPADGITIPLSRTLKDFRFIPLANCGHHPWRERAAKDRFYRALKEEISE